LILGIYVLCAWLLLQPQLVPHRELDILSYRDQLRRGIIKVRIYMYKVSVICTVLNKIGQYRQISS